MNQAKAVHLTSVHSALDARIFHRECRSLARAGFRVTIIGPHSGDTVVDHVRIRSIKREKSRLARMTRTVWRVYREARMQHADIYHFHDPELIPVGLLLRAGGKRVIYDIHEDLPKDVLSKFYLPAWSRKAIAWITEGLEGAVCGHFSALITVSPAIAERFRPLNHRTVIVHNYPYPEEVVPVGNAVPWEKRRSSVAYTGNMTALRAIREMVFAMAYLPEKLPATLELAGNEVFEDVSVEELHGHAGWARVVHHGILDRLSTFRLLNQVRAGLVIYHPVPNHLEAMPQKIFEYMGAGIPVIASDFPFWRSMLESIGCAIFVDPKDPRAIAEAIEYVLTHPAEAEEMGRRGQSAMLEKYTWNTQAEELVKLYSALTEPQCAA